MVVVYIDHQLKSIPTTITFPKSTLKTLKTFHLDMINSQISSPVKNGKANGLTSSVLKNGTESIVNKISRELFGLEDHARSSLNKIDIHLSLPGIIQEPLILNYWGATGTGKTQLAKKIIKEKGLTESFHYINLANSSSDKWEEHMEDIKKTVSKYSAEETCTKPIVLFFDEIQHIRTINENNHEIERGGISDIWGILDEGIKYVAGIDIPTIIFVAGNIDLSACESVSQWAGAPEQEKMSTNVPEQFIHEALSKRFRPEMIARLRTNHFVFSPIDKERALLIIRRDLNQFKEAIIKQTPIETFTYDNSLTNFLFKQLTTRGMGARGIESMVNEKVKSEVGSWFHFIIEKGYDTNKISSVDLSHDEDSIIVRIAPGEADVITYRYPVKREREKLKHPNPEEMTVYAVHEAGHALAMYLLNAQAPELVSIGDSLEHVQGYMKVKSGSQLFSAQTVMNNIIVSLSGFVAEQEVFGAQHVTSGSATDLQKAQELVGSYVLKRGFGRILLTRTDWLLNPPSFNEEDRQEMEAVVKQARRLSEFLIRSQLKSLIALAKNLFFYGELTGGRFRNIMKNTIDRVKLSEFYNNRQNISIGEWDNEVFAQNEPRGNSISHKSSSHADCELSQMIARSQFSYLNTLFGESKQFAKNHVLNGGELSEADKLVLDKIIEDRY